MKISSIKFDGTPEEFQKISNLFVSEVSEVQQNGSRPHDAPQTSGKRELSVRLVERALNRRSLSKNQKGVLKTLLKVGESGLYSSEIADQIGIDRAQLAGVMGAFGRRTAGTHGWPEDVCIFEYRRDDDRREWQYWLPNAVREALTAGNVKI